MKKHNIVSHITLMVVFLLTSAALQAQGPPPPVSSAPDPIDGGVYILLIGAAVYGYYKLKQQEKSVLS